MKPKPPLLALAVFLLGWIGAFAATDDGKKNDVRKKLLEKYPNADLNKDGVLSDEELLELKKPVRKSGGVAAQPGSTNPAAPATRSTKEEKEARRRAKMRVQPTFTDVAYGPFARNSLDFWKADSPEPAPVMVLIHAGGFSGGDK